MRSDDLFIRDAPLSTHARNTFATRRVHTQLHGEREVGQVVCCCPLAQGFHARTSHERDQQRRGESKHVLNQVKVTFDGTVTRCGTLILQICLAMRFILP